MFVAPGSILANSDWAGLPIRRIAKYYIAVLQGALKFT